MAESNKTMLEKANAAIRQGDHEGFLACCTENTTWEFVGDQTLHGKEAVRTWMATAYQEPPRFEVSNLVSEGDLLIALGTISLKDEDGVDAQYDYCNVWRFEDGKMAGLKAFVIRPKAQER